MVAAGSSWVTRALARLAGVRDPGIGWRMVGDGPWFDNQVATLIDRRPRACDMRLDKAVPVDERARAARVRAGAAARLGGGATEVARRAQQLAGRLEEALRDARALGPGSGVDDHEPEPTPEWPCVGAGATQVAGDEVEDRGTRPRGARQAKRPGAPRARPRWWCRA